MNIMKTEFVFKIPVVGNAYTGKTTFLLKNSMNKFFDSRLTVGSGFIAQDTEVTVFNKSSDKFLSFQVKIVYWDLAGNARFRHLLASYLSGANAVIVVYDTRYSSMISLDYWMDMVSRHAKEAIPYSVVVCSKMDEPVKCDDFNKRFIASTDKKCQENGYLGHYLTSSRTDKPQKTFTPITDVIIALLKNLGHVKINETDEINISTLEKSAFIVVPLYIESMRGITQYVD